jgi:hypothetical protein
VTLATLEVRPNGHLWLRVCKSTWEDPVDTSFARQSGGRWNSPESWDALYLSRDLVTARSQLDLMVEGSFVTVNDLRTEVYQLVGVGLPNDQVAVDVVSADGVAAAGFASTYPLDGAGNIFRHEDCWPVAREGFDADLDGVECRSAKTTNGSSSEFCWWPRGRKVTSVTGRVTLEHWISSLVIDATEIFTTWA